MMKPGQTRLNKDQRQKILAAHIEHANFQGKELSVNEKLKLLRIAGYPISQATLYLDENEIARNDPFIKDLASKTYSSIMHTAYKRYNKIYDLAMKIHDAEEHLSRTITKETDKGTFEDTITEKSANAKLQALMVAKNATDSIRLMINGENIRISASRWVETTKQQEAIIQGLREKLKQYDDKAFTN